jgi:hypothetical protein
LAQVAFIPRTTGTRNTPDVVAVGTVMGTGGRPPVSLDSFPQGA